MSRRGPIAIVDDDGDVLGALASLVRLGTDRAVRAFLSGPAFLADADEPLTACLVTDVQMPGMSGLDLVRFAKAAGRAYPIILITATLTPLVAEEAHVLGVDAMFEKPFEADALLDCIRRLVGP